VKTLTDKSCQHFGCACALGRVSRYLESCHYKSKKCADGTVSLITLNCDKGLNQGVTCTSIFLVLRSFNVENQLAVLSTTLSLNFCAGFAKSVCVIFLFGSNYKPMLCYVMLI